MDNNYIEKLIDNLSTNIVKKNKKKKINYLNIIAEAGGFNGSYLFGSFLLLEELRKRKYLYICKISTASISSVLGFLFLSDIFSIIQKEEIVKIVELTYMYYRKKNHYNIDIILNIIKDKINDNFIEKVNNRLYITYYNVRKNKQIVISKYKSIEHLFEIIRRSCYVPYISDDNLTYKGKYIDGLHPYIFKNNDKKIKNLYLNLHFPFYKIIGMISIKNEKNNFKRILIGICDTYSFFINDYKTEMCSYIENWSVIDTLLNYVFLFILKLYSSYFYILYVLKVSYLKDLIPTTLLKVMKKYKKYLFKLFII